MEDKADHRKCHICHRASQYAIAHKRAKTVPARMKFKMSHTMRTIYVGALQGAVFAYFICQVKAAQLATQSGAVFLPNTPRCLFAGPGRAEVEFLWMLMSVLLPVGAAFGAALWMLYSKFTREMSYDMRLFSYIAFAAICIASVWRFIPSTETTFLSKQWKEGRREGMLTDFLAHHALQGCSLLKVEEWLGKPDSSNPNEADPANFTGTVIYRLAPLDGSLSGIKTHTWSSTKSVSSRGVSMDS